ncbi:MAG: hypothetical protein CTY35_00635 [Methylotenera sp.]|uniref:nucleotidyl transferase AbiEii/AbiGii toxin family protein n=1 Tax=Methylotenera sp. TaxID=2051956 RepID=UPI000D4BC3F1|nr:nucleotidyl transferase AbiEii/AbiGii toxin family protein [Methylotenera sp.]PPC84860.1 MAG: hypothetical protein CTY38_00630 [Methylotenera sp.]PPD02220.1 MAG: hypothetical protein CTY35_00635 [Methylotenera sp.]
MINENMMPTATLKVYQALAQEEALRGVSLIGGTALSIQLSHRLSEDLDFFVLGDQLNSRALDEMVNRMSASHNVRLLTPTAKISQARINGIDLLSQARDYAIDGVKVTIFARNDQPYRYFNALGKSRYANRTFDVMTSDAVFAMKSWLLQKRVKSRDMFDLMKFMQKSGTPVSSIFSCAKEADPANYSEELIKLTLTGEVPLDDDDEGFTSIGLQANVNDIYRYFSALINEYEVEFVYQQQSKMRPDNG